MKLYNEDTGLWEDVSEEILKNKITTLESFASAMVLREDCILTVTRISLGGFIEDKYSIVAYRTINPDVVIVDRAEYRSVATAKMNQVDLIIEVIGEITTFDSLRCS